MTLGIVWNKFKITVCQNILKLSSQNHKNPVPLAPIEFLDSRNAQHKVQCQTKIIFIRTPNACHTFQIWQSSFILLFCFTPLFFGLDKNLKVANEVLMAFCLIVSVKAKGKPEEGGKVFLDCHYLRSVTGHAASGIKWLVKGESWCDCLTMAVMKKSPKRYLWK